MQKAVNTHEAKTHLSRLLKRVALGEEIIIASRGQAVARLVPIRPTDTPREFDTYRGQFVVPDDFDAPLPDDLLAAFEGRSVRTKKTRKKT